MRTEQPCLTTLQNYITFLELNAASSQAFDFPTLKNQTRLEPFLDEIVVSRLSIQGDGAGTGAILVLFCSHQLSLESLTESPK